MNTPIVEVSAALPLDPPHTHPWTGMRATLLAVSILALLAGLWGALGRLGWGPLPHGSFLAALHGPLMISGLFGTLIVITHALFRTEVQADTV
jgi:hypothetical protein